jgi:ABC-2 type transport system permease protein
MNRRIITALLKKDLSLFLNNRFYLLITIVGIVFYIGIYFILPSGIDEKLSLAIHAPIMPPVFSQLLNQEGFDTRTYSDVAEMKNAVLDGDFAVAISLPADIMEVWEHGGKPEITVYYASTASAEIKDTFVVLIKELAYMQTGQNLNFNATYEILGPDMLGTQISLRDRLRPLLAVFILLTEILTLASLISVEIEQGTVRALFATPMRTSEIFVAKGVLGVSLALVQSALFMLLVGGFNHQPLIIFITLLLGSLMVVGTGFLVASVARDMMAITGWGMLILIIFAIPGFGTSIPGLLSNWTKIIPSYYLTDTVNRVANYNAGWADIGINLAILAGFTALVILGGMAALRRRYQ